MEGFEPRRAHRLPLAVVGQTASGGGGKRRQEEAPAPRWGRGDSRSTWGRRRRGGETRGGVLWTDWTMEVRGVGFTLGTWTIDFHEQVRD